MYSLALHIINIILIHKPAATVFQNYKYETLLYPALIVIGNRPILKTPFRHKVEK